MATTQFFPGFTRLTDQIFIRDSITDSTPATARPNQPKTIIIFAWGDALPKHVTKYCDGFRTLYPAAKQIAVLSPIMKTITRSMPQRIEAMKRLLDEIYGSKSGFNSREANEDEDKHEHTDDVLVLAMSNTGGIAYAATLHAYRQKYGRTMPHRLAVLDSTPGSTDLTFANMKRFSLAMALGTASWFPWPFVLTQGLWAVFLYVVNIIEKILGRKSAGAESLLAIGDPELSSKNARRLYLYGKEDRIILYSDIEKHVAGAREEGWKADCVVFEDSGHVEHMRRDAVRYWGAIQDSWEEARTKGCGM
ncbi:TMEM53 family protein [Aspergillus undulatus]|uniref:TMEM53 family protein n=1 Tax=Aspergillus undulatus TaxID=1810928 RepID=UPI003CCCE374